MVIAPAKTGNLVTRRSAVIDKAHNIRGIRSREISFVVREHKIVVMKLILPKIEEIPAK
jgi:hypothetical protein